MLNRANELERVVTLLQQRERRLWPKIAAQIACGILLTLSCPALLATIVRFAAWSIMQVHVSWWWVFAALAVILVPLLVRLELRTAGCFLEGALRESRPTGGLLSPLPGTYVALGGLAWAPVLANPRGFSASATEIFLCGPRLLVGAVRRWRFRRRLGKVDVRRAAQLVAELAARDEGLELSALPEGREQLGDLLAVLNWLAFHGWIGVGAQVPRVYLYSEARAAVGQGRKG